MTRSRRPSGARGDGGAAAVEFALLLPFLLLLLFGIIEFGRAYNMQISLTHGAREGVRVLALGGTAADATNRTTDAAFPVTGVTVTTAGCPATVTATTPPAEVTATRDYDFITPIAAISSLPMLGGGGAFATLTLTGHGEMRCTG